jgi:hypothetical protein
VILVCNFRYQDVFVLVAQEILVKMQFKHNQNQLEGLDDDDVSHESTLQYPFGLFPSLDMSVFFIAMCILYQVCRTLRVKYFI